MKVHILFISLLVIAGTNFSCTEVFDPNNFPSHVMAFVDDKSASGRSFIPANPNEITEYILNDMRLEEQQGIALNFYTMELGNPVPSWDSVMLHGRNMYISSIHDRSDNEKRFKQQVRTNIDSLFSQPYNLKISNVYRGICSAITLVNTTSGTKTICIRSDYKEASDIMVFDKIDLSPSNYEAIKNEFLKAQVLPVGIDKSLEVVLILSEQSPKSFESLKFFEWLLTNAGAQVSIRSSL